ncbi:MAG: HAMP domain-containing sensor histidine kinase [Acidimicrobiaceae bacterium]
MRLSTRITVLLVVTTALVAFSIGWLAISISSRSEIAAIDAPITAVINSGLGNEITALDNALNTVQENNYDVTLVVISPSNEATPIRTGANPLTRTPTIEIAKSTLHSIVEVSGITGFRIRSMPIGGGDFLLVAASTLSVQNANHRLERQVFLAGLLIAIFITLVTRRLMRSSFRTINQLIEYAEAISKNNYLAELPKASTTPELSSLQSSLGVMVENLKKTIEIEKSSNLAMQRFIGDASHELRTPLTVIKGYSEMLQNVSISDDQKQRAADRVEREVDRMDALIGDLLFLAEINETPFVQGALMDLSTFTTSAVFDFKSDNPERQVTSRIENGVYVIGTENFFHRMVTNAFTNIQRYTPSGAPVNVTLTSDTTHIHLKIEDGGPGLSSGYGLSPQRFARGDDSRSRESGGSGLGMSIMADVARAVGGSMKTEQSSLGGLAIIFDLPLATK